MPKRRSWMRWPLFSLTMLFIVLWGVSLVVYAFHMGGRWRIRMDYGFVAGSCYFGPRKQINNIASRGFVPAPSTHGWPTGWGLQSQFPNRRSWRNWYPKFMTTREKNMPSVWALHGMIPFWMPTLLAGVPTLYLFWRDRRNRLAGFCGRCGYNLFGNKSGKCPECGREIRRRVAIQTAL